MKKFIQDFTDFIFVEDIPEKSDIIFIPGGPYGAMCHTAAKLWHDGFAPFIMPSGRFSKLAGHFPGASEEDKASSVTAHAAAGSYETECDYFCTLLSDFGVPKTAVLKENRATFTYENALFSKEITDRLGLSVNKAILCCQAYHARRCLLYYEAVFPDTRFFVCPTVTRGIDKNNWYTDDIKMNTVLGEIERCGTQFHEIIRGCRY